MASKNVLAEVEPLRRRLYVSGASLVTTGVLCCFISWNYIGALLAIAAGAICCDSFLTKDRLKGRAENRIPSCSCCKARNGCCEMCCIEAHCGAPLHLFGGLNQ